MRVLSWLTAGSALLLLLLSGCRRQSPPDWVSRTPPSPVALAPESTESTILRLTPETVLEQPPSTVEIESADGGTKVTMTDPKGSTSSAVITTESDLSAEKLGIPLPPKAKANTALRLKEAQLGNPLLQAFDVAGMRVAIYTVPGATLDSVLNFYAKHKSGRFEDYEDARSLGMDMVIIGVRDNEDLNIALVPEKSGGVTLMLLDQSKTKLAKGGS